MAREIGEVKIIIGKAELIGPEGAQPLRVGDKVFSDQIISTGANSAVELEFLDGSLLDLPRDSQVVLDNEIYDPSFSESGEGEATDDIAALQQALLDGEDPTQQGDSTAANSASQADSNEGSTTTQISYESPIITPESGFESGFASATAVGRTSEEEPVPPLALEDEEQSLTPNLDESPLTSEEPTPTSEEPPVAINDEVETDEDISIVIDVLANDTRSAGDITIMSNTAPENGTVQLNDDGTFTYTPSANYSGTDSFTYTLTDSAGNTSTTTANINVTPVADLPTGVMFVSGEALSPSTNNLIVNGSFEDINGVNKYGREVSGVSEGALTGSRLVNMKSITGWDLTDPSMPAMEPHAKGHGGVGSTDGQHYMDLGSTPGNSAIVQQVAGIIDGAEYKVSFDYLDKAAKMREGGGQASLDSGVLQVLWNGEVIAEIQGNNAIDWETVNNLTVIGGSGDGSNELILNEIGLDDDNHGMAIDNVEMFHVPYQYDLTFQAQLTDVDGSETLSPASIDPSLFPDGVYFNGVEINSLTSLLTGSGDSINNTLTLTSDTPLTGEQINKLTVSVTSTETANNADETAVIKAKVLFDGLDASAESDNLAIFGDANDNDILGGSGDDIIFGGAGDDSLTGGNGADTFVWTKAHVGVGTSVHDTVVDFDPTGEGDVIVLSDLLSDSSHTIEGLAAADDTGTGQHLQLSIKDTTGAEVQTIDLNSVAIGAGDDPSAMLNNLLSTGAIDDGI